MCDVGVCAVLGKERATVWWWHKGLPMTAALNFCYPLETYASLPIQNWDNKIPECSATKTSSVFLPSIVLVVLRWITLGNTGMEIVCNKRDGFFSGGT